MGIMESYINKPQAVIMLVVPAYDDLANHDVVDLVRAVDNVTSNQGDRWGSGRRTILALSQCNVEIERKHITEVSQLASKLKVMACAHARRILDGARVPPNSKDLSVQEFYAEARLTGAALPLLPPACG